MKLMGTGMLSQITTARVLLVDDDAQFLGRASAALDTFAELRMARCGLTGLNLAMLWNPHVIVVDLLLDDVDGFTFLERLDEYALDPAPFILYTCTGPGADTRVRPLPNWRVGTLLRTSSDHQLRAAVLQAVSCQDPIRQQWITA
jgi:DNA-binding response OmpR family regulator